MYFFISFLLAFSLIFSNNVYASEVETDEYEDSLWHKGLSTLQDSLDNVPKAMSELRDTATSFGVAVDSSIQTLVNAPVKAVMSNFLACSEDMIDECTNLLTSSRDFMSSIFINPIDKTFLWNDETVKLGHDILKDRFVEHYEENVPRGFHKADSSSPIPDYGHFVSNRTDCYFTYCKDGNVAACCSSGSSFSWQTQSSYFDQSSHWKFSYNGVEYVKEVKYTPLRSIYRYGNSQFPVMYPPVYDNPNQAFANFYNFTPSSGTRPNGKGYFKPLPKNTIVKANGNNVYNNNWGDIIVNNYTTYGDTFENTVYNNYYYSSTNKDTPVYWYDIYDDNNPVVIPSHDYDDLSDITLADPNIVANHNFITDVFSSIPVILSTLFISLLLLSIVIMFLKG